MRILLALLAFAGMVVSALALQVHYSTATEPCSINERWDCGIVNHSSYAEIAHVPVAAIGILGYLGLAGVALLRLRKVFTVLALVACSFALYLSHIERDVLTVWCLYCVISQSLIAVMVLGGLGWTGADLVAKWRGRESYS
jgi:uncharacterized membrane protein